MSEERRRGQNEREGTLGHERDETLGRPLTYVLLVDERELSQSFQRSFIDKTVPQAI